MNQHNLVIKDSETQGLNRERMRRFLKNLAAIYLRSQKRRKAHEDLHSQLKKVQKISMTDAEKKDVNREINELKDKINTLLEMKGHPPLPGRQSADVKDRIVQLESKLNLLLSKKTEREERIQILEDKIKKKLHEHQENRNLLQELRNQLNALGERYHALEGSKKHSKKELNEVKDRIEKTKKTLRTMESEGLKEKFS